MNVFLGDRRGYYDYDYETHYLKEDYTVDRTSLEKSKGKFGNMNFIGVYQFSDTHSLGVNANVSLNDNDGSRSGMTVYNNTKQHVSSFSDRKGTVWGATANLNYQYHSKDGKRYFIADADYLYNDYQQHVINEMNNVDEQGNFQSLYLKEQQEVPQRSDIYSGKVEYGGKSDNGLSYDFGADAYYSHIHTDNQYWNCDEYDLFVLDPRYSSDFKIKEFTSAFFFDLDKWWGEKFHTSLSARMEYTKYDGKEYRQNTEFENDFFRVLPKLNTFYRISKKQSISYMLSYSLSRPSFYDMNPFVQRISPTEYSVGNPYLQPVKNFFTELNYTLGNLSFYLQYQLKDDIQITTQKDVGNGVVENKPENIGKRNYVGFGISGYFPYMKNRGALSMNANYSWFKMGGGAEVGKLDYSHHSGNVTISNSFLLFPKQNIRFNLIGLYSTKEKDGSATRPSSIVGYAELNTSIKKFSLAAYAQLVGYMYDGKLSGTEKYVMSNEFLLDNQYLTGRNSQIGLRCSYSFGNNKVKRVQQRNTSNSGVRGRVNVNSK